MTTIKIAQFCVAVSDSSNRKRLTNSQRSLTGYLSKFIYVGLLCSVLGASTALAMSPSPPAPSDLPIPAIEIIPDPPSLSATLTQTEIRLDWGAVQHAKYYVMFAYIDGVWEHLGKTKDLGITYHHRHKDWDLRELQFRTLACKNMDWWLKMLPWEWFRDKKQCSEYSNIIYMESYLSAFNPNSPILNLSAGVSHIDLSWSSIDYAENYQIEIYNQYDWQSLGSTANSNYRLDYNSDWDLTEVEFWVKACNALVGCGNYSDSVRLENYLPEVNTTFTLAAYPQIVAAVSAYQGADTDNNKQAQALGATPSSLQAVEPVGAAVPIMATLRLRDALSWEYQDIAWPIFLDTQNFTVTSNQTVPVVPGSYNIEFLATVGNVQYAAKALNIPLNQSQQSIPLALKTVIGDTQINIDNVASLPQLQFDYDTQQLANFSHPKIGIVLDNGDETLLSLNPETGISDQYHALSSGRHQIELRFHDGVLLRGRSRPEQESRVVVADQSFTMELVPIQGQVQTSLNTSSGEATFNLDIPTAVVDQVGGNPANLQILLSVSGLNNQPEDVVLTNLTYNATRDIYEAQYTYTAMQADTHMAVSLRFTHLASGSSEPLGSCMLGSFVLDSSIRTQSCQLTLRRLALPSEQLLAVLGVNVSDAADSPIRGAQIYAKRQVSTDQDSTNGNGTDPNSTDNEQDLGILLGLTASGAYGSAGYLEAQLVSGIYRLTARYIPAGGTIEDLVTLSVSDVTIQPGFNLKTIGFNHPPSITITAPTEDVLADNSDYTIEWTATDMDDQAGISLYYEMENHGDISGNWQSSSGKSADGAGNPVYQFEVTESGSVSIDLISSIDTYLYLLDNDGSLIAENDDISASDPNSRLSLTLDPGSYRLVAATYSIGETGNFAISIGGAIQKLKSVLDRGTLITDNLLEGVHTSYQWDTSGLAAGFYYLYAKIDDGTNSPEYAYASSRLTIAHISTSPLKLNDTGIDWGGNYPRYNNSNCTGQNISQQDCRHGRDALARLGLLTKVGGGAAGFDFTRLNADGSDYTGSGDYASQPWACVRDNHTGLIWEVKTDDGGIHDRDTTYRWGGKTALVNERARTDGWGSYSNHWDTLVDGSNQANAGTGLCGTNDWRVPTVKELAGITHKGRSNLTIDTNYFPNTVNGAYWSSLPREVGWADAWVVSFSEGNDFYVRRNYKYRVRIVAAAPSTIAVGEPVHDYIPNHTPDSRYTLHSNGTVTDTWTGLIWQRCSLGQTWDASSGTCTGNVTTYNWQDAMIQAMFDDLAGHRDWRLPNIEELRSLVAYDRHPTINRNVFPNTPTSYWSRYWSSSPDAGTSWYAWGVSFYHGYANDDGRSSGYAVRLVRSGQ